MIQPAIPMLHVLIILVVGSLQFGSTQLDDASSLVIRSPEENASWSVGSSHLILWDSGATEGSGRLTVTYSRDDGETWSEIAQVDGSEGAFLWVIPDDDSETCRIRIDPVGMESPSLVSKKFGIVPSREVPEYRWTQVTAQAAFAPRDGAGALTFEDRMWLLGGWNPGDRAHFPLICNNEVWSSTDGKTWRLDKPNTFLDRSFDPELDWEGRHTAGYAVFRDKLWIVGGDVNQGHYQSDVWNSTDGREWSLVNRGKPVPWGPRALHYTVVFRDKIWVIGGQTMPGFAPSEEVLYRDVWNTEDGIRWTRITPAEPCWTPRGMIGGAAVHRDRIWILGGGTYDTPDTPERKFYHDVWSTSDGQGWERHSERAPWDARQYHEVAAFDDRLWVLEGYSGSNRNDVWYSDDGVNWYEVPETPWAPRHAASVFVFDNALWVVAGNNMESDVWRLDRMDEQNRDSP